MGPLSYLLMQLVMGYQSENVALVKLTSAHVYMHFLINSRDPDSVARVRSEEVLAWNFSPASALPHTYDAFS